MPNVAARPAATVMLIRDGVEGIEVLMVRRHGRGFFGGLTAFPGGAVDPVDRSDLASAVVIGDGPDQEFRVAALRELAEETGLALIGSGVTPAPPGRGAELLTALGAGGLLLDGSRLVLVSRWVTPEFAPTRFDTRFYLAGVGDVPEIRLDPEELVAHMWIHPADALALEESGELKMFLPTIAHLRWLERRADVEQAIAASRGADGRSLVQPRRMGDGSLVPIHLPDPG
ncbi:MAG TPA: NUDIX domain-containing protein [Acidimicrobiia bacterium]